MVVQLLHEAYLGLLLHRLVGGAVFATRKASWVQMNFTGSSINAAMRTAGFM